MPYAIGEACIDQLDGSCVAACPIDCIYEGLHKRYINPHECIECGACLMVCPVAAVQAPADITDRTWLDDNARFFAQALPGRNEPVGAPGGANIVGPVGVDTPFVTSRIGEQ